VASRELQGWHPDPFGLHEMRYFSVGIPTKLVRDGRVEAYHEPPDDWSTANAAGLAQAVDGERAAGTSPELPSGTLVAPADGSGHPDQPGPTHVFRAVQADSAAFIPVPAQGRSSRPRGRRVEYAFVAIGAVVAVLVFVALGGGAKKPGIAPAAFVTKAAQRTLAQHTADFMLSGTVTVGGQSVAIGGSGQVDFATGATSLNMGGSLTNGSRTVSEVLVGGNLYMNLSSNGQSLAAVTGGRHWIEVPLGQSGATGNDSLAASLSLLSQSGAKVTSLGSSSIGGRTCSGYAVTPSRHAMLAAAQQEYAKLGLPAADINSVLQVLQAMQPPTITVWFDPSRQVACQESVYMPFGAPTAASSASVRVNATFTHYGVPVKITAPAASDTITLKQLLKIANHKS
jgi:hypothetical protein